ncbi:MAG: OmpL47-type beta-barrel domain-containing protein, partial [Promethearchaeota archaeon]
AGNGSVLIEYNSTDNVGNVETTGSITVRLDTNAPNTSISYTPAFGPDFVNTSTLFSLTANDGAGESGISFIEYNLNSTGWLMYVAPFSLSSFGNGTVSIAYRSIDNAGNLEIVNSETVHLDSIPAASEIHYTPYSGVIYVNRSTLFTLTASDNETGVKSIEYKISDFNWTTYTVPFNLSGLPDGFINISYRAIDQVGNVEGVNVLMVILGSLEPLNTTLVLVPATEPNIINRSTLLSLEVISYINQTIAGTYYRVDGGSWINYTGSFTLSGLSTGNHLLEYYSIDVLNNSESIKSTVLYLDVDSPVVMGVLLPEKKITIGDVVNLMITCDGVDYVVLLRIYIIASSSSSSGLISSFKFYSSTIFTKQVSIINVTMDNLGNGTYKYEWNTDGLDPGNYILEFEVIDQGGNVVVHGQEITLEKANNWPNWVILIIIVALALGIMIGVHASRSKKKVKVTTPTKPPSKDKKKPASDYKDLSRTKETSESDKSESDESSKASKESGDAISKKGLKLDSGKGKSEDLIKDDASLKKAKKGAETSSKFIVSGEKKAVAAKDSKDITLERKKVSEGKPSSRDDGDVSSSIEKDDNKLNFLDLDNLEKTASSPPSGDDDSKETKASTSPDGDHSKKDPDLALVHAFKDHDDYIASKTEIYTIMLKLGFSKKEVEDAMTKLQNIGVVKYSSKSPRGWHYIEGK